MNYTSQAKNYIQKNILNFFDKTFRDFFPKKVMIEIGLLLYSAAAVFYRLKTDWFKNDRLGYQSN